MTSNSNSEINANKESDAQDAIAWWIVIVVIILLIVLFIWSGISRQATQSPDEINRRKLLLRQHERLESIIQREKNVKKRLQKRFEIAYFFLRLILVCLVAGWNWILYSFADVKELGDFLNWNEAILIVSALLLFLFYKNPTNINAVINQAKYKIESWVYGKHLHIKVRIMANKKELEDVQKELLALDDKEVKNIASRKE